MYSPQIRLTHFTATLAVLSLAATGFTQVDVNPPRPNVLLLVDNSGSMEYRVEDATLPDCNPGGTGSGKSRWIHLVEVLTGAIPNYSCEKMARNSATFQNEYKIANANPPDKLNPRDYLYPLPYHRPLSGTCAPTPGINDDTVGFCRYNAAKPCADADKCTFPTATGGLLDAFATEVRFGLMTFDTLPDASTDMVGTWSYVYGQTAQGAPHTCDQVTAQEVGARNAKAPVWEGRMMAFGPPAADNEATMLRERNAKIQNILLATRPFGATPIAGMLRDAKDFFWEDPNPDGSGTTAPKDDPYSKGKCRDNFIILLTDGEPNMDLRPFCEGENAVCGSGPEACCPFKKPDEIAWSLANDASRPKVKTYVVGFAVTETDVKDSTGKAVACQDLSAEDLTSPSGLCATNPSSSLKICCTLNRIAYNGDTQHAYFASTVEGLRSALAQVLSNASKHTTSRTFPVFAASASGLGGTTTFRFFTSFKPNIDGSGLWQGVIDRQRYVCANSGSISRPEPQSVDVSAGDDFVKNVNKYASNRVFHTVVGNLTTGDAINSTRSIRMKAANDGLGSYTGTQVNGKVDELPPKVLPAALDVSSTSCITELGTDAKDACRDRYLKWLIGGDNGTSNHRCPNGQPDSCNLIADIYHSVPAVMGAPRESLRDDSYQFFTRSTARKRPVVLYTSTNDGLLHAFKVASNDPADTSAESRVQTQANNELWSFIPPAVLPRISQEYPNIHMLLLDGAPIVKDVVGTTPPAGSAILLERDMHVTGTATSDWRTILVQSFGAANPGYFALDVTDPVAGPKFLWQLTTDDAGQPLFGDVGGTPTIATLYFDPSEGGDQKGAREIPVALLPGGDGGAPPSAECQRGETALTGFESSTQPRTTVPCYTDDAASPNNRAAARRARSLTIVRLDSGEIVRTFRRSLADAPVSIANRVTEAKLDSPITGQPVAYPGWTGAISDRAYVGDRDGSLWRLDLSSTLPSKWTMKLMFDAYHGKSWGTGQPIATTPLVSTDDNGKVVVLFSTGSQDDLIGTPNSENFVYSIREEASDNVVTAISSKLNWYLAFTAGRRVAGPMSLFASNLYFSTYAPPSQSSACDAGSSSIWGMHYTTPKEKNDLSKGGTPALPKNGDANATEKVQEITPDGTLLATGSTIFGVGVAELQSCGVADSITDPAMGQQTGGIAPAAPASYQLVVQTGRAGSSSGQTTTNTATISLPNPGFGPFISGWTLVME
jgi:type IV pilus assembly protein PilY1